MITDEEIDALVARNTALTDEEAARIRERMAATPLTKRLRLFSRLAYVGGVDLAKSVRKATVDLVLECWGVLPGEAGVGMPARCTWCLEHDPQSTSLSPGDDRRCSSCGRTPVDGWESVQKP